MDEYGDDVAVYECDEYGIVAASAAAVRAVPVAYGGRLTWEQLRAEAREAESGVLSRTLTGDWLAYEIEPAEDDRLFAGVRMIHVEVEYAPGYETSGSIYDAPPERETASIGGYRREALELESGAWATPTDAQRHAIYVWLEAHAEEVASHLSVERGR